MLSVKTVCEKLKKNKIRKSTQWDYQNEDRTLCFAFYIVIFFSVFLDWTPRASSFYIKKVEVSFVSSLKNIV